ncbi:hypothetical protein NKG05_15965 [Oerskovia sp. M15]
MGNAEAHKIAYATHTGDVVENYTKIQTDPAMIDQATGEYEFSSAAQKRLDDSGIPNGILAGNHDNASGADTGAGSLYNQYYGPERYQALSAGWENASYGAPWREGTTRTTTTCSRRRARLRRRVPVVRGHRRGGGLGRPDPRAVPRPQRDDPHARVPRRARAPTDAAASSRPTARSSTTR